MLCSWFYKHTQHLAFIGLGVFIIPVWADIYIADLKGGTAKEIEAAKIEIIRNGKSTEEYPFNFKLKTGDNIIVPKGISIILSDNTEVTDKDSPYRVEDKTVVSNHSFGEKFSQVWGWIKNISSFRILSAEMGTQEGEEKIPKIELLKENNAKLVASQRQLHLAWQDGEPPYQVELFHHQVGAVSERSLVKSVTVDDKKVTLKGLSFQAGQPYQVIVTDKHGNKTEGTFTAVAQAQYDTILLQAKAITQSKLSSQVKKALLAAWLVNQEQGQWRLQAYQKVAGITEQNSYLAFLVQQGLQGGIAPLQKQATKPE